ncbi:MAG: fasciclin domain-containing protein [Candidatus Eisenbacteria bacterium]|uniref:Fasciclin domain-containing protein n=1 Tax=Eiseniibacteriota bacterium TaxID=2212470 RepID=A0A948WD83_UNCEI|nr:fasciclin domain-containing protein [Candidatus Eisenbacteria bacterium]MBU1948780.1 fasciclin domain-containing protein [Candidatus Eisenbacteria bacterium]MBU2691613.1 fasciclin domain-containing protein [Candidatus Eisenbacteria bacterium]
MQEKAAEMKTEKLDIVDTAVSAGSFNTLVTAVRAAGLVDLLKSDGPFTVFAPSDEAFAKLPEGAVASLLKDKEALTKVLTFHVVPGKVPASEVIGLKEAKTAQGQSLQIEAKDDGVMVGGATVIATDIFASNGVIHVIDTVMMPK